MMTDAQTRATYDQIAAAYAAKWQDRTILEQHLAYFAAQVRPGGLVLDIGCGPGFDSQILRARGLRPLACDLSSPMLLAGRALGVDVPMVQADMRRLPAATAAIDGLWVNASLLHLDRPAAAATLAEFVRILRPGGILFLAVKLGQGEGWTATSIGGLPRFFVYWEPATLDPLLAAAGFSIIAGESGEIWLTRLARLDASSSGSLTSPP